MHVVPGQLRWWPVRRSTVGFGPPNPGKPDQMGLQSTLENFSRLRRIALNLLKQEKTLKRGIKAKKHKAGWDEQYMLKVLQI